MDATLRVRAMLSFVQAADHGSFAAAARNLGISPAAVGKNVAGLEGALGVRLMNRSTRSLQLTSEGRAFVERAREAISALDAAIDTVAAQRAEPAGRVRITTSSAFGQRYLLPLLPGLLAKYPRLVPELDFEDRRVDIVQAGYDIAVRGGNLDDSSLVSRHVCELRMVLVASVGYLRQHGVPKRPADLKTHKLVALRFLNGNTVRWRMKAATAGDVLEFIPEPATVVLSDPQAAVDAAVAGLGVSQAAAHHALPHLKSGKLKIVLAGYHDSGLHSMALQYPHRALVAPRVKVTVEYLLAGLKLNESLWLTPAALKAFAAV